MCIGVPQPYKSNLLFFVFTGVLPHSCPRVEVNDQPRTLLPSFWFARGLDNAGAAPTFTAPSRPAARSSPSRHHYRCAMIYRPGWTNWMRLRFGVHRIVFYFAYGTSTAPRAPRRRCRRISLASDLSLALCPPVQSLDVASKRPTGRHRYAKCRRGGLVAPKPRMDSMRWRVAKTSWALRRRERCAAPVPDKPDSRVRKSSRSFWGRVASE